jgi:MFS family permease
MQLLKKQPTGREPQDAKRPLLQLSLLVVIGLGITWILDGLEVTIVGSLGPALQSADTLYLSSADLGAVASFYVVGAVVGALIFGWITDRHGRRVVFYVTLMVYLSGVLLSAFARDSWSFAFFWMLTGLGIGGEYAAVNSAIDELIRAKYRGSRCQRELLARRCGRSARRAFSARSAPVRA